MSEPDGRTRVVDSEGGEAPRQRAQPWRLYGASWWHLASVLGSIALAGAAVRPLLGDSTALTRIAVWFVGAAVAWDLVLGPLLAGADAGLRPLHRVRVRGVRLLNYVRVPLLLSALLLLVWAPLVLQRSEGIYRAKTGLSQDPYLERWVAVSVALVVLAALAYGVAVLRAARRAG